MDNLPQTQNSMPAKPTMSALGPDLSKLLDSDGSPDRLVAEIVASPALIAEARAALPALQQAATALAGEDGVRRILAKRFETYPQPQRTDAQWAAWFEAYYEVGLPEMALSSVEAGMRAWVARPSSQFMPKPGELLALAETTPSRARQRYYRARMAIAKADEPPAIENRADPEAVRALFADFQAKAVKPVEKPPLPDISGKADETGITPQMRASIARRQEMGR